MIELVTSTHSCSTHQVRVACFLHHLLLAGSPHDLHRFLLAVFDHSLVVVVQAETHLGNGESEAVFLLGKLHTVVRPGKDLAEQTNRG